MSSYAQIVEQDRRLQILQLLAQSAEYKVNQFLLLSALDSFGHAVSMDRLKSDIAWLAEQGLAIVGELGNVQVPQLTDRGLDVAQGRVPHPGVKRPRP